MKYRSFSLPRFFHFGALPILALVVGCSVVAAQQPSRPKRPVKNPPQYPNIIDLEGKEPPANPPQPENASDLPAAPQPDALARAVLTLAGEMKTLTQEIKALNIRSQAQLDMMKMTRIDLRIDHYERELRPVRDRMSALDAEENTLLQLMTRESLQAQTAQAPTFNREELMRQLRAQHEVRLRAVRDEKERLRKLETDVTQSLNIYQKLGSGAEQRIQDAEELLKQIEGSSNVRSEKKPPQ